MSFEDSEKAAVVTLQQHYNFVMNRAVSITYDLWHIIFMKILLIEDNQRTGVGNAGGFPKRVMSLMPFLMAEMGFYLALKDDYALIILDIMLPGMDGWQILQTLRTAKQNPLLFALLQGILSMTESEGWTVEQNDYLVKPFSFF
ncbi:response regulator [Escherichia coli]